MSPSDSCSQLDRRRKEYVISTYAGGASLPISVAGVDVPIVAPTAVCVDPADNVYFIGLDAVFKLDRDGKLTRVAGRRDALDRNEKVTRATTLVLTLLSLG